MLEDIGKKIKVLRTEKNWTLKDLSERSGYSTGFLSQLERGMTSVAVDTLTKLCDVFEVDFGHFVETKKHRNQYVLRSYEREVDTVDQRGFVNYFATPQLKDVALCPRLVEMMPMADLLEEVEMYGHLGEEFVYVIEGILTLLLDGERIELYPGDIAHYPSEKPHNWANRTTRVVKLLTVHTPNYYQKG